MSETRVVAVVPTEVAEGMAYGMATTPDRLALGDALKTALDPARVKHDAGEFVALAQAFEGALQRYTATEEGFCPNNGEATESCDCLTCRTQTLLAEWEDSPVLASTTPKEER